MLSSKLERSVNVTPDEADWLLARMSVAWPSKMLNVEEVRFWIEKLQPYTLDDSVESCNRLEDTCKFWPSWSEFKTSLRAVQNSHEKNFVQLQQPKEEITPPERVREIIANIKANHLGKV